MRIDATPAEAQTILKAMCAVAAAGAAITAADRASIVAAARYIFQVELAPDLAGLAPPRPEELKTLAAKPDLATEAVCFATVMAFVDGTVEYAKLNAVIGLATTLGVKAVSDATAYCAAKFGVVGFTRALAAELAGTVGVTLLIPGGMRTAFFDDRDPQYQPGADAVLNDPANVAAAVLFALSQPPGCAVREMVVCADRETSYP